jgi:hypothetical protein
MQLKLVGNLKIFLLIFFNTFSFPQDGLFSSSSNLPYADAGADIEVYSGLDILLDGTQSYSDDGSKIKYTWIFSPGLVLNKDNNFSSDFLIETYDAKYLRSLNTFEKTVKVNIAKNDPGIQLEVFLEVKNSLGFKASDTLIVKYSTPVDTANLLEADSILMVSASELDSTKSSALGMSIKNEIELEPSMKRPFLKKLNLTDQKWTVYAKYPLMAGGVYLILDKIFFNNSNENKLEKPPSFPHDS